MKKSAAQKLISKISQNRKDAILKHAYEVGSRNHAIFSGLDEATSNTIAKKASACLEHAMKFSEQRKAFVKSAILNYLHG